MGQSLSKVYVHIIFHIKTSMVYIRPEHTNSLYAYMGGIIKELGGSPIKIGGVSNHIHILCTQPKNISSSQFVEKIKSSSSKWIKDLSSWYDKFYWQSGYGIFSVSASVLPKTIEYISNQADHHKKRNYKDEYISLLKLYDVEYNDVYLFDE